MEKLMSRPLGAKQKSGRHWYAQCCKCSTPVARVGSGGGRILCAGCRSAQTSQQKAARERAAQRWAKQRAEKAVRIPLRRKQHLSRVRQLVIAEKLRRGKCEWPEGCPLPNPTLETLHAFDFDHRNPDEKKYALSKIRAQSEMDVLREMDKCDLLCAYHHRIRTQRDRHQVLNKSKEAQLVLFNN